ncbi:hypothetical protein BDN70DRAFT_208978 [Pholiota conissans]|uniref:DUF6697 domain-containing protein n=1 Tax=Pholiota conissans TaxID=109636 RepID=A0A9P6CXP7_9AGAR|nr:hypothetical protein BDN70DRAFT_208978 [Pholiota conissans]
MVTRFFMASEYGGNMQATCPRPSKAFVDSHVPGAPGLWFCVQAGEDFDTIMRVFVKIAAVRGDKKSKYQYQGMYQIKTANPPALTVSEWSQQAPSFHNKWAHGIVKMGWGAVVRSRILLRRELNREPTSDEVDDVIQSGVYKIVTEEDVKQAYFRGDERMGVWTMKCVAYDNRFQQKLHDTFPMWVPPPPKRKKKAGDKKAETKKKTTPPRATENRLRRAKRKRRNDLPVDGQSESDGTVESVQQSDNEDSPKPKAKRRKVDIIELTDDEEPQAPIKYRARGTKSRPIFLN